jgi:hypothetical protein
MFPSTAVSINNCCHHQQLMFPSTAVTINCSHCQLQSWSTAMMVEQQQQACLLRATTRMIVVTAVPWPADAGADKT